MQADGKTMWKTPLALDQSEVGDAPNLEKQNAEKIIMEIIDEKYCNK
jgi:hypothetical protein